MNEPRIKEALLSRLVRHRQGGFTLVEVLVALLILSVGLLGLAGLQTNGLRSNKSAALRSQATQLASDMLDRMRANRADALAGDYVIGLADAANAGGAANLPLTDLTEWKAGLANQLPGGQGSIAVNGSIVTIQVGWSEALGNDSVQLVSRL